MPLGAPFGVRETHGILWRPENEIRASSDRQGWVSAYASAQKELPYEGYFSAVPDQLLVLHLDGPVTIDRMREKAPARHLVPAGGIHLVPGGMDFGVRLSGVLNTLHVYIRRAVIEEVAADIVPGDPAGIEIPAQFLDDDRTLKRLLEAMNLALFDDHPASGLYVDYLSRTIASHLVRAHAGRQVAARPSVATSGRVSALTARGIDYMREHLAASISLDDIAEAMNCSASHFARQFRNDLNLPPHQYLVGLRLELARSLLANSRTPIAQIAFECGFSHQEHLTRLFRRNYMTTPAAYRRARQN